MKPIAEWNFSAARNHVDIPRIVREANEAAVRLDTQLPAVIRVKVDGETYTLAHQTVMVGFSTNGCAQDVKRFLDRGKDGMPFVGIREGTKFIKIHGETGFTDPTGDANEPAEWTLIAGDWLKELTDRTQVRVEVY